MKEIESGEINFEFWESLDAANILPRDLRASLIIARDFGDCELREYHKKRLLFFEEEMKRGDEIGKKN